MGEYAGETVSGPVWKKSKSDTTVVQEGWRL